MDHYIYVCECISRQFLYMAKFLIYCVNILLLNHEKKCSTRMCANIIIVVIIIIIIEYVYGHVEHEHYVYSN